MSNALKVKIYDTKGTQILPIAKSTVTVGSASHCDVVLNHASVQSEHLRAWSEGGRIWVQDLGSTTGTSLNGIRLPSLKPMLVRELDILKLGECPSTLGLEPNLVRAPVVKARAEVPPPRAEMQDDVTVIETRFSDLKNEKLEKTEKVEKTEKTTKAEANERREDIDRMSRELADLKLQSQMSRFDRDSLEEMRKEMSERDGDFAKLREDKEKLQRSVQHLEQDRKAYKKKIDDELSEMKLKALRELKDQRDEDTRKFDNWKKISHTKVRAEISALSESKTRAWNTRPLSKDMVFEWEADIDAILRKHLLGEKVTDEGTVTSAAASMTPPALEKTHVPLPPTPAQVTQTAIRVPSGTKTGITKVRSGTVKTRGPRASFALPRWAWIGIAAVVAIAIMWTLGSFFKDSIKFRSVASQSSVAPPPLAGAGNPAGAPAAPRAYAPGKTPDFKRSYTENMLYTSNYLEAELNKDVRAAWLQELSRAARNELKVDPSLIIPIMEKERALLSDLGRIRGTIVTFADEKQGMARMRAREAQFMRELQERLGKKVPVERYIRVKKAFFARNPVYLAR